jgi:hypothetical protein
MDKRYKSCYPPISEDQFGFTRAVVSMLNARRYIESQGFIESRAIGEYECDVNSIAGRRGIIVFSDGSNVGCEAFQKTKDRDSLLERIIAAQAVFQKGSYYGSVERNMVIRCSYQNQGYYMRLSVIDTTKQKKGFIRNMFSDAELFAFSYVLSLVKEIINDSDILAFNSIVNGIGAILKETSLLTYAPHQIKTAPQVISSPATEQPAQPAIIIDPWNIEIPRYMKNE